MFHISADFIDLFIRMLIDFRIKAVICDLFSKIAVQDFIAEVIAVSACLPFCHITHTAFVDQIFNHLFFFLGKRMVVNSLFIRIYHRSGSEYKSVNIHIQIFVTAGKASAGAQKNARAVFPCCLNCLAGTFRHTTKLRAEQCTVNIKKYIFHILLPLSITISNYTAVDFQKKRKGHTAFTLFSFFCLSAVLGDRISEYLLKGEHVFQGKLLLANI